MLRATGALLTPSEPKGRHGAWTEERGAKRLSDEGRHRAKAARRRAREQSEPKGRARRPAGERDSRATTKCRYLGLRLPCGPRIPARRRRPGPGCRPAVDVVAVARGRLHDVPAAVPVPRDRQDPPAADRTPQTANQLLVPEWDRLAAANPDLAALFPDESERSSWLLDAAAALDGYFTLEDPRRLEPAERECYVETELESGLKLRGYIDRLDMTPAGDIRIVDYKTGRVPREAYEASALFQMKFYALVIWRVRGVIPRMLQLMYLSDGEVLRYAPDEADLRATQRKIEALWLAIERARAEGDWRPRPGRLCDWCRHKALCPES